jgi:sterol desaturase/sphingolipid hydroxylase (fatty acid hydroxylase superfamily)
MEFLLQRLGLVGRSAVYVFLERRYPAKKVPFLRAGPGTDVLHLLFTEVFTNAVVLASLAVPWFPLQALKWNGGLLGLWAGLHANVRWRFGAIGRVLGTPDFHHWHHAWVESGRGHNFGTFTTLWDRLFGTFHLPDERPVFYGTTDPVPRGYLAQLTTPLPTSSRPSPTRSASPE